MKKLVLLSFLSSFVLPGIAFAQTEEQPAPEETTTEPAAEPAPPPPPPPPPEPAPVVAEPAVEAVPEESNWYDDLSFGVFTDAYFLADWNMPADPQAWSAFGHRAYDDGHGFGLAFAGADLKYAGERGGATISLRYGQGAASLIAGARPEMSPLWQAYGTWNATDALTFDLGQFGTIYGAEVAESWVNLNYSRGALYYLMQPFYHTGLRVTYEAADTLTLKLLAVNGTNNLGGTVGFGEDGNQSPHLGAQVGFTPSDVLSLYVGYYTGAGSSGFGRTDIDGDGVFDNLAEDGDWEHFVDVVAVVTAGDLTIVGNADFYALPEADAVYWGISGALGYKLTETFGVAGRLELLHNPDEFITAQYKRLVTATGTLDYRPDESVVLRLETRFESANTDVYQARDEIRSWGLTSTLSGVVHFGI